MSNVQYGELSKRGICGKYMGAAIFMHLRHSCMGWHWMGQAAILGKARGIHGALPYNCKDYATAVPWEIHHVAEVDTLRQQGISKGIQTHRAVGNGTQAIRSTHKISWGAFFISEPINYTTVNTINTI